MSLPKRRAIEALRAGVPNKDAVRLLQAHQPGIDRRFGRALDNIDSADGARGFIIGGEFGAGKSHVLEWLSLQALERNCAVSKIVISKETPLSDLDLVFKAAVKELRLPNRRGGDLYEILLQLEPESVEYIAFQGSLADPRCTLDNLFKATFLLSGRLGIEDEFVERTLAFWSGDRIGIADIRKRLKDVGAPALPLKARRNSELASERFAFLSHLIRAAKYRAWVILVDEVELVASFPLRGRARSYINLMWLLGRGGDASPERIPHSLSVAAATREFTGDIFGQKKDDVKIGLSRFGLRDPRTSEFARRALQGIEEKAGNWEAIVPQTAGDLDRVYAEVRQLYGDAFDWDSASRSRPPTAGPSMRMHMREWITRWDLQRLDPTYIADIEAEALSPDLNERTELEGFSDRESEGELSRTAMIE